MTNGHLIKRSAYGLFAVFALWLLGFVFSVWILLSLIFSMSEPAPDFPLIFAKIGKVRGVQRVIYAPFEIIPCVDDFTDAVDSSMTIFEMSEDMAAYAAPLLSRSLQGQEIDWVAVEYLIEESGDVGTELQIVLNYLKSDTVFGFARLFHRDDGLSNAVEILDEMNSMLMVLNSHSSAIRSLLGYDKPMHVVVLTQNNMELWPTGGYLGSFVEFFVSKGAITDLQFQDIGVPNGQVKGYVEAPKPISTYTHFGQTPGWKLRESNWNPDFPTAMHEIEWFFIEGGVEPIDLMMAINLIPVVEMLKVIGPVYVADYQVWVTAENFYEVTQKHTSYAFFDGSTQKKDYLSALGFTLLSRLEDGQIEMTDLAEVLVRSLLQRQLLISSKEPHTSMFLNKLRIDGSLGEVGCEDIASCSPDYLHINEANLGINKANCCVERSIEHMITLLGNFAKHRVIIDYINNNPAIPKPPETWGGGYKVYQRWYVPKTATNILVLKNEMEVLDADIDYETIDDKLVFGFMTLIEGGTEGSVEISYQVPVDVGLPYQLKLVKQSGIDSIPWKLTHQDSDSSEVVEFHFVRNMIFDF
jgi:hypothetical protein